MTEYNASSSQLDSLLSLSSCESRTRGRRRAVSLSHSLSAWFQPSATPETGVFAAGVCFPWPGVSGVLRAPKTSLRSVKVPLKTSVCSGKGPPRTLIPFVKSAAKDLASLLSNSRHRLRFASAKWHQDLQVWDVFVFNILQKLLFSGSDRRARTSSKFKQV